MQPVPELVQADTYTTHSEKNVASLADISVREDKIVPDEKR